jgi:hypothetical protein
MFRTEIPGVLARREVGWLEGPYRDPAAVDGQNLAGHMTGAAVARNSNGSSISSSAGLWGGQGVLADGLGEANVS